MSRISVLHNFPHRDFTDAKVHTSRATHTRDALLPLSGIKSTAQSASLQSYWRVCLSSKFTRIYFTESTAMTTSRQATTLQFLDLSQNPLDKKSVEYIVAALTAASEPGLVSLRLDDCSLRPTALEVLCKSPQIWLWNFSETHYAARSVRTSSLRNISLRHNRINATGAVALALMIRDYPDVVPGTNTSPSVPSSPTPSSLNLMT